MWFVSLCFTCHVCCDAATSDVYHNMQYWCDMLLHILYKLTVCFQLCSCEYMFSYASRLWGGWVGKAHFQDPCFSFTVSNDECDLLSQSRTQWRQSSVHRRWLLVFDSLDLGRFNLFVNLLINSIFGLTLDDERFLFPQLDLGPWRRTARDTDSSKQLWDFTKALFFHICVYLYFFPLVARYFPSGFHQSPRLVHTVLLLVSNPHVLIYNGHQLYVHFFLVQLCPSIFSCFLCTTAYFTLWRRCFPLGFHQSPRSSHLCLLAFPTPA